MRKLDWQTKTGATLVLCSISLYGLHYALFRDVDLIFPWLIGNLAFLPIEVLLVTLIIHRLLAQRERQSVMEKMNMVIGAFFSEVGHEGLKRFCSFDREGTQLRDKICLTGQACQDDLSRIALILDGHTFSADSRNGDLKDLQRFLASKRHFLLLLLENHILLEHEKFTDVLWAVFHLCDELSQRRDVSASPENDLAHISGDMQRAYRLLALEWLSHMRHLQRQYPYLFSLAVRMNPFDPKASAIVQ